MHQGKAEMDHFPPTVVGIDITTEESPELNQIIPKTAAKPQDLKPASKSMALGTVRLSQGPWRARANSLER